MDLATTHAVRILSFTPEKIQKIPAANEIYSAAELVEGGLPRYRQTGVYDRVWKVMICQKSLDTDVVAFASALERYFMRRATWLETLLFWAAALRLFRPAARADAAGRPPCCRR